MAETACDDIALVSVCLVYEEEGPGGGWPTCGVNTTGDIVSPEVTSRRA